MAACQIAITEVQLEDIPFGSKNTNLFCDVSLSQPCPLIPISFPAIFLPFSWHQSPGIWATSKHEAWKYIWHGHGRQVGEWAESCIPCQQAKVHLYHRAPLSYYNEPKLNFLPCQYGPNGPTLSLQGFLPPTHSVDRVTHCSEEILQASANTKNVTDAFLSKWITRYGLPFNVSSDQGSQFTFKLWQNLSDLLRTKVHQTTAYHPHKMALWRDSIKA